MYLCNQPFKGFPRIKKRQKTGLDHKLLLNRRRRSSTVGSRRNGCTSQFFRTHLSRNIILPSKLFPNLLAPNLTMGSHWPHSKCQHASSGADNARVDKCWSAMLQLGALRAHSAFWQRTAWNRFGTARTTCSGPVQHGTARIHAV